MKEITIRRAGGGDAAFIKKMISIHHRHNPAPVGWLWAYIIERGGGIVAGVATVGRPVNRVLAARGEVEVTRVCVWGTSRQRYGVCSAVYRRAALDGATVTYTRWDESGVSLRAAGWVPVADVRGRTWRVRVGQTVPMFPRAPADKIRWAAPPSGDHNAA